MARFSSEQLRDKALQALEEAYLACRDGPVAPTAALRFALAWLGNEAEDRAPFDEFWKVVTGGGDKGVNPTIVDLMRSSNADGALRAIYRASALERPMSGPGA
jgi:hypothetical protein